jgi:hypothetical protein
VREGAELALYLHHKMIREKQRKSVQESLDEGRIQQHVEQSLKKLE